jgi:hypothetical protein
MSIARDLFVRGYVEQFCGGRFKQRQIEISLKAAAKIYIKAAHRDYLVEAVGAVGFDCGHPATVRHG